MKALGVVRVLLLLGIIAAPAAAFADDKPVAGQPDVIALRVARVYTMAGEPVNKRGDPDPCRQT